jgi:hypothetical protein
VDPPCEFEALSQAVSGFQNVISALDNVTDFPTLSTKLTEGGTFCFSSHLYLHGSFILFNLLRRCMVDQQRMGGLPELLGR